MKKIVILKKKLVDFAVKAVAGVVVCAGLTWFVVDYFSAQEMELQAADTEINQKKTEIMQIEDMVNVYEKSFNLFVELQQEIENNQYELDPDRGSKILELLSRKHRISSLTAEIETKQKIGTVEYVGYNPVSRKVSLKFMAMSDAHIYAFLRNIDKYFSGNIKFINLNISQKRALDYNVLSEASKGATPELLDAKVEFIWLGIEQKTEPKQPTEQGKI